MVVFMSVMNRRPEKELFEEVALLKNIDPSFIEKDWFVTQVIAVLADLNAEDFEFVFTGGTALSKAHHLIQRFSEDVDFRVIASHQNRKALSNFKHGVVEKLRKSGFAIEDDHVQARDANHFFSIDFYYPSHFARSGALRPHVQIEITIRALQCPQHYLPVSSFVNAVTKQPPEVHSIACIDPAESASDKLSALAWRIPDRVRGGNEDDPSLVRHIHDLALLKELTLTNKSFATLVEASMQEDDRRSKNNPSFAGLPMSEKFRQLLTILETDKEAYAREYDLFVRGVSYAAEGDVPDFTAAVEAVHSLVEITLNQ
jgi:hypothetical protein